MLRRFSKTPSRFLKESKYATQKNKRSRRVNEGIWDEPTYNDFRTCEEYSFGGQILDDTKLGTLLALATKDKDIIRAAEKINEFANDLYNEKLVKEFAKTIIEDYIDAMQLMDIEDILEECDQEEYRNVYDIFTEYRMYYQQEND